jgi:DNA-binding MurR/RpiR family transcriptional regulator
MEHPDRATEDTQQAIAGDLGVDPATVSRAMDECGKELQVQEVNTDEKRERVREPGNREVYSHRTPVRLEYSIRARAEA